MIAAAAMLALVLLGSAAIWWETRPRTRYAPGFSEERFATISTGDSAAAVAKKLGDPLSQRTEQASERWCYGVWPDSPSSKREGLLFSEHKFVIEGPPCLEFSTDNRALKALRDRDGRLGAAIGAEKTKVKELLGEPHHIEPPGEYTTLFYSALDGDDGSYEVRAVVLDQGGRVREKIAYTLWD